MLNPLISIFNFMSRTKKGSKAPGFEYWSARPGNKFGGLIGKTAKVATHKAERRNEEREKLNLLKELK